MSPFARGISSSILLPWHNRFTGASETPLRCGGSSSGALLESCNARAALTHRLTWAEAPGPTTIRGAVTSCSIKTRRERGTDSSNAEHMLSVTAARCLTQCAPPPCRQLESGRKIAKDGPLPPTPPTLDFKDSREGVGCPILGGARGKCCFNP